MNFVVEIEKVFNIKLSNRDIISRDFRNIHGLILTIYNKFKK